MFASKVSTAVRIAGAAALTVLAGCATVPTWAEPAASEPAALSTAATDYFPPVVSREAPEIRFAPMRGVGPDDRQFFVDQVNLSTASGERPIPIVAQAVGARGETLLLVNIEPNEFLTPYIARAMLARMTSLVRFLPAISEMGLSADFDIYNMGAVLGFERIVVTDGRSFSHEAVLTPAPSQD